LALGHLPSVNHTWQALPHAESMRRHQPESDHTITSRGAAAGPDRSSTGHEAGTIVIAHRVGTIARAASMHHRNRLYFRGTRQLGRLVLILAAGSAIATALLWAAMPETMPAKYLD
jgi:hypothetical protein